MGRGVEREPYSRRKRSISRIEAPIANVSMSVIAPIISNDLDPLSGPGVSACQADDGAVNPGMNLGSGS